MDQPASGKTDPEYSHIGWVPCITGRLFFKFASCNLAQGAVFADRVCNAVDESGNRIRHVVISSVVDWRDIEKDHDGASFDGKFRVTLVSTYEVGAEKMQGKVFLIPLADSLKLYPEAVDEFLDKVKMPLQDRPSADFGDDLGQLLQALRKNHRAGQRHPQKIVDFTMDRCGFVHLAMEDASAYINSQDTVTATIRSAYYYIKYTWHKHKHHHPGDESLTTVHKIVPDNRSAELAILDHLKQALLQKYRTSKNKDLEGIIQARGILSYANALIMLLHSTEALDELAVKKELSSLQNLDSSFQRVYEQNLNWLNNAKSSGDLFRNGLLLWLSLVAPLTLLFKDSILAHLGESKDYSQNIFINIAAKLYGHDYGVILISGMVAILFIVVKLSFDLNVRKWLYRKKVVQKFFVAPLETNGKFVFCMQLLYYAMYPLGVLMLIRGLILAAS